MARIVIETSDKEKANIKEMAKSEPNMTMTRLLLEGAKFRALYKDSIPHLLKLQAQQQADATDASPSPA